MNVEKIFKRFGRPVTAYDKNGNIVSAAKCYVQPLRYKNKMYLEGVPTEIGLSDSGYFLLLAPPSFDVTESENDGYLSDGNLKYHIDKCDSIYFGEKICYLWAILRQCYPDTYPVYNHFA